LALLYMFCYGCIQIHLVYKYMLRKKQLPHTPHPLLTHFPFVTVQLPLYNERLVVERLIDAVARFSYPKNCYEIQVLDDSTDDTTSIVAQKVSDYQKEGVQITHIRRANRKGFKAGALQEGLQMAKGEFVAIFDADFVPPPDFLQCTLPHFTSSNIGVVQTRWEHLNKHYSWLTRFQAFLLDAHFSIEQGGRNSAGYFINFSGTAGIWRKSCMIDAGGWHADTLTEDFDISYRAQLKGWKFKYLEDVTVPAELPPVMSALKSQQYRWIKGNAETARKHLGYVLRSRLPFKTKLHAFFHLLAGSIFIFVFISSFVSIPLLLLKPYVPQLNVWFRYASFSIISLVCLGIFHYVSTVHTSIITGKRKSYFFKTFPLYLIYSMGISLNNAKAVAEGLLGKKSAFIRTPKFNISASGKAKLASGQRSKVFLPLPEMLLVIYFLAGVLVAFHLRDYSMVPYHLMLAVGFGMICYYTWKEYQMQKA
jgi:cellulose synthase/poly-beta-1,6-N-acetylglucosamine synthase-like glycosyltransferase